MPKLRRLVLIRHGETDGRSSERFHGSGDVALSAEGCRQMREAARRLAREVFDLVVASPLRRSWEAAWIVSGGAPVRLETDFREIDFGRWEGLTKEEIEASDPVLFREWQAGGAGFEFPGGEPRGEFRARVLRGLERLQASGATAALVVGHKGVIRVIAEKLLGRALADGLPALAGCVSLTRAPDGVWYEGRQSSDPEALARAS
jgi:broad specificity phosphatase PhoE